MRAGSGSISTPAPGRANGTTAENGAGAFVRLAERPPLATRNFARGERFQGSDLIRILNGNFRKPSIFLSSQSVSDSHRGGISVEVLRKFHGKRGGNSVETPWKNSPDCALWLVRSDALTNFPAEILRVGRARACRPVMIFARIFCGMFFHFQKKRAARFPVVATSSAFWKNLPPRNNPEDGERYWLRVPCCRLSRPR